MTLFNKASAKLNINTENRAKKDLGMMGLTRTINVYYKYWTSLKARLDYTWEIYEQPLHVIKGEN